VNKFSIYTGVQDGSDQYLFWFSSTTGGILGTIFDLVWHRWTTEAIPHVIGDYAFELEIPRGWKWKREVKDVRNVARFEVQVIGIVATARGMAERLVLRDAESKTIERSRTSVSFDSWRGSVPVSVVYSEEELDRLLEDQGGIARISWDRVPLPRIQTKMYWPPSDRSAQFLHRVTKEAHRNAWQMWWHYGLPSDPIKESQRAVEALSFEQIEGTELATVYESIMRSHPARNIEGWPVVNPRSVGIRRTNPRMRRR
jgi:hypothetical protein